MLPAGRLRHSITIEQPVESQDDYGSTVTTWEPMATVRAEVKAIQGREYWAAQSTQSETTHQVRLRYVAGVTTKMRVSWDGALLDIESVIPDERKRELTLMCVEKA